MVDSPMRNPTSRPTEQRGQVCIRSCALHHSAMEDFSACTYSYSYHWPSKAATYEPRTFMFPSSPGRYTSPPRGWYALAKIGAGASCLFDRSLRYRIRRCRKVNEKSLSGSTRNLMPVTTDEIPETPPRLIVPERPGGVAPEGAQQEMTPSSVPMKNLGQPSLRLEES